MHRIVRDNNDGTVTTKGDANAQADSTPVPKRDISGLARLRVPWVGLPKLWVDNGEYLKAGIFAVVLLSMCAVAPLGWSWEGPPPRPGKGHKGAKLAGGRHALHDVAGDSAAEAPTVEQILEPLEGWDARGQGEAGAAEILMGEQLADSMQAGSVATGVQGKYAAVGMQAGYAAENLQAGYAAEGMQAGHAADDLQVSYAVAGAAQGGCAAEGVQAGHAADDLQVSYAVAGAAQGGCAAEGMRVGYAADSMQVGYLAGAVQGGYAAEGRQAGYAEEGVQGGYAAEGLRGELAGQGASAVWAAWQMNAGRGGRPRGKR